MDFLKKDTNFDFLGARRVAAAFSAVLLIICIGSMVVRGFNWGIDFTGGTLVEVAYEAPVQIAEVRDTLSRSDFDDAVVQYFGTSRDIMIRLPARAVGSSAEVSGAIMTALRQPVGEVPVEDQIPGTLQQCVQPDTTTVKDCAIQMERVEFVGPQVGDELVDQGGLAMLYALIGILIYVAWRFEWRFALGSIAALVHDVLVTLGIFALLQMEFSLPVLAAVLAVIGYSLNDTIVVFDRVRENFRKIRRGSPSEIMNTAINQTLRRTLLTSMTTLIVVLTLLLVGGEVIRGFSAALLIGVIVGTYSSIFVASPTVLVLGISREDMVQVKKEGESQDADAMP